jgi:hypothetical protein
MRAVRKAAQASSFESIKSTPLVIQVRSNELSRAVS